MRKHIHWINEFGICRLCVSTSIVPARVQQEVSKQMECLRCDTKFNTTSEKRLCKRCTHRLSEIEAAEGKISRGKNSHGDWSNWEKVWKTGEK